MKRLAEFKLKRSQLIGVLVMGSSLAVAYAGTVTLPNAFTAGSPASAAQVNANFNAVKTAVDDNHARITALEAASPATGRLWVPIAAGTSAHYTLPDAATNSTSATFGKPADYQSGGTDDVTVTAVFAGCEGASARVALVLDRESIGSNSSLSIITVPYEVVTVPSDGSILFYPVTAYSKTMTGFGDINLVTFYRDGGNAQDSCAGPVSLRGFIVEYPRQ